jgi:putative inorganic carbon (HCO3(-)) transporter
VAARNQRTPVVMFALIVLIGGAAGAAASHRVHHSLDPFAVVALGMGAAAVGVVCLVRLEPAWILTGGLMLSVFSGNWSHLGVPIPVDRVVIVCGIGSAVVRSLRAEDGEPRLQVRGVHWLMVLLILYAVGSAAWSGTLTSHEPLFALLDRLGVVPFLLYFVAPTAFRTARQRRILAVGLLILGAYLGLITLFEAVGLRSLVLPQYILNPALGLHAGRARGPFLEAGANGLAMFVCVVAAAVTWSWWRDWRMRAVVIGVIVLGTAGILFTLTRQTWLAAAGGTVVAMLADRRLRRWLPLTAGAAALIVVLSLAFIPGLSNSVSQRSSSQMPVWDRLNSDAAALRMAEARPALGFGWGRFGAVSVSYYRLAGTYPLTSVGDAHNVLLSNASELGLVGLGLWLVIVAIAVVAPAVRRAPPPIEPWRIGLIAIVVAWFLQLNFTPLDYAFDNYVIWLWAGVVFAGAAGHIPARPPGGSRVLVPENSPPTAVAAGV